MQHSIRSTIKTVLKCTDIYGASKTINNYYVVPHCRYFINFMLYSKYLKCKREIKTLP